MKRVISTQAIMANGKTTYTGLFTSEGIPAEVELVCVNGNACLSVTIPEDDEEEYVGRPLTEDEIEWLNAYHHMVREYLSPLLAPEQVSWLEQVTKKI